MKKNALLILLMINSLIVAAQGSAPLPGTGRNVYLDRYFNSEKRPDASGRMDYWHYTWEEKSNPGFSMLGEIFTSNGAQLFSLDKKPTSSALRNASIYIIVDPDHLKDNSKPNYVTEKDITVIRKWVRNGGVLLLMANDSANCELTHFNRLAGVFGFHFTDSSVNMVKNDVYAMGIAKPVADQQIFGDHTMFLKDVSPIDVTAPAKPVAIGSGKTVIAETSYGKGTVLAVGDPWLYNEYIDNRKLPKEYENLAAARDLVKWLLKKSRAK